MASAQMSVEVVENKSLTDASEDGLSGWLRLEGLGIREVHLENLGKQNTAGLANAPQRLHLRYENDGIYKVPVGAYRIAAAQLAESATADLIYSLQQASARSITARVVPDGTETLRIGGPLTERFSYATGSFGADIVLSYAGCFNESELRFSRESLSGRNETLPMWEVRDASGMLVRSGRFSFG